jgi:hypothetical protein
MKLMIIFWASWVVLLLSLLKLCYSTRDLQMTKQCEARSETRRTKWRRLGYYPTNTVATWEFER